ncbi:hypothetical protein YTPLAS18_31410 [Nitrospira sp.]|nr:hypothetical protein YTPLAS18_31410 [Nitrospira sp.]
MQVKWYARTDRHGVARHARNERHLMYGSMRGRRSRCVSILVVLVIGTIGLLWGCSSMPRKYVKMAEPGLTLTTLASDPERYRGKVAMLGGTIVEEDEREDHLLIRLTNRPLDQDYMPHRPADPQGPEGGRYWITVAKGKMPRGYHRWARVTVVGRVTGLTQLGNEPVLALLYVRGWGMSGAQDGVWEYFIDPNYVLEAPGGIQGEFGGIPP